MIYDALYNLITFEAILALNLSALLPLCITNILKVVTEDLIHKITSNFKFSYASIYINININLNLMYIAHALLVC